MEVVKNVVRLNKQQNTASICSVKGSGRGTRAMEADLCLTHLAYTMPLEADFSIVKISINNALCKGEMLTGCKAK